MSFRKFTLFSAFSFGFEFCGVIALAPGNGPEKFCCGIGSPASLYFPLSVCVFTIAPYPGGVVIEIQSLDELRITARTYKKNAGHFSK